MDLLCLALLFVGAGMALVIVVMLGVTQRAGHQAITRNFQDAQHIVERHAPPPHWLQEPRWRRVLTRLGMLPPRSTAAHRLQRIDALITFFGHSTFFADEQAREALLGRLRAERERWQNATEQAAPEG